MTEPRTPDEQPPVPSPAPDESPTQAWPSLDTPPGPAAAPSPEAAAIAATAAASPASTPSPAPAPGADSEWEPAPSLPPNHVDRVGDTGTFGAPPAAPSRRGTGLRWALAIIGVLVVAAASFVIVSLVGGRPATSVALGYMPANVVAYNEVRLDLPGDQREKLATFLKPFPGFQDASAFDAKLNEVLDRLVRAASKDEQTWTADIAPWFGGQIGVGMGLPDPAAMVGGASAPMAGADNLLVVVTIRDRAKAIAWIERTGDKASLNRTTYGDADLLINAEQGGGFALAVNDKVILGGTTTAVKAAVDSNGKSALADDEAFKAALATVQKDYVMLGITNVRAYADWIAKAIATSQPGVLESSQIDETVLAMLPGWFATTGRFENDAFVSTSIGPAGATGYDTANHIDQIVGHVPAGTILLSTEHDVGPALAAIVGKFRALPETASFFRDFDRAVGVLGGFDAAVGWWGDSGIVVSKLADGTIGGGLVIKPRDAVAADRLVTTLDSLLQIGGASTGVAVRTVDHNGTKITVVDYTGSSFDTGTWPAGYKPEIAVAANADVAVIGMGQAWVESVLDAGPGKSLADDARFKALLERAGNENIAVAFLDIAAIRGLIEPLAQQFMPADSWAYYAREIQPYLKPLDALISTGRKDGSLDRGVSILTAH